MPMFCKFSIVFLALYHLRNCCRYLDQPRYVGYSFGYGEKVHSSVEAAQDFITFLEGFMILFPEFVGREVVIAGMVLLALKVSCVRLLM